MRSMQLPANLHPSISEVLANFEFEHLPPHLAAVSRPFAEVACRLVAEEAEGGLGLAGAELTVCLRKMVEAKDCAVRAAIRGKLGPTADAQARKLAALVSDDVPF